MGIYNSIYQEEAAIYRDIVNKVRKRYYKLYKGRGHFYMIRNFYDMGAYENYPIGMSLHEASQKIDGKKFLLRIEMKNLVQYPVAGFDGAERKRIRKMINGNDEEMVDLAGKIISKFRNKRIRKYGKKTELG
jgi:hypothetical protein